MKKIVCLFTVLLLISACVGSFTATAEVKQPLKVLAIGNSYSNNTTEFVSKIAESMGYDIEATSLYYPGCSLKQHVTKYENDIADYVLFVNGKTDWKYLTLKQALENKQYDIITLQDSPPAVNFSSFHTEEEPYLKKLYGYVKLHQPNAQIMMHETWAYCGETIRGGGDYTQVYYESNAAMQEVLTENYRKAAELLGGIKVIQFGKAVNLAVDEFGFSESINDRDTVYNDTISHLNKTGSYLASCVWVETLTGADVRKATFTANIECADILKEIAHESVSGEKSTVKGDFRVFETANGLKLLKDYREIGEDGIVDIPTTIDGKKVKIISRGIYKFEDDIKQVNVPTSLSIIETGAFKNFKLNFVEETKEEKEFPIVTVAIVIVAVVVILISVLIVISAKLVNKKKKSV